MTDAFVGNLLMILQAKFTECRQRWTQGNDLLYRAALKDADDAAFDDIRDIILYADHPPRTDELLIATRKTANAARTYTDRGFDMPGYERQAAGATPYDLMREGFNAKWLELHPGTDVDDAWKRAFARIDTSRQQRQEERRAKVAVATGGDDDDGYDPFAHD